MSGRNQYLGGFQPCELQEQFVQGDFGRRKFAGGHVNVCEAGPVVVRAHGGKVVVRPLIQQGGLKHRTRRHHAHDAALHDAPRQGRVAELFADRHLVPLAYEAGQVGVQGDSGDAGHRDASVLAHGPGGERDLQGVGEGFRVVVEALVKISHPEQQNRVRVGVFDGEVLPAHGSKAPAGSER